MDYKVKSNCLKIFNEYGFSKKHPSLESFNNDVSISSFKDAPNTLLDAISNSIIDNEFSKTKSKLKKVKTLVR